MHPDRFALALTLEKDYAFSVHFDDETDSQLTIDEPPPLGQASGPDPKRLLGAAVGSCLGSSLLFCLRKARVPVADLRVNVEGTLTRNAQGRLRIERLDVRLEPCLEAGAERLGCCVDLFKDFCTVTESVRQGITVDVTVEPCVGALAT